MIRVTLYTKRDCSLCDDAREMLRSLHAEIPHELFEIDVESDPVLQARHGESVPVVQIGPYTLRAPFSVVDLRVALSAARQGRQSGEAISERKRARVARIDRAVLYLARHWLALLNLVIGLYVGMPFLAPVLMHFGATTPARWIYLAYRPLCHQAAFRSWFLFGEQAAYPRVVSGVPGVSYEEFTGLDGNDLVAARQYVGDARAGYKVAFCERDVAIYGGILIGGLIYALVRRRLRPLPLLLWFVLGVIPIGLDGGIQLLSELPFWPLAVYESTPLARTLTGAAFGLANVWMAYPYLEESMADTVAALLPKLARVDSTQTATPAG